MSSIVPCLWFDTQAEEAANFYVAAFGKGGKQSGVKRVAYYLDDSHPAHAGRKGTVLTVEFELDGQAFTALNGGPIFTFNEAISLQVICKTQDEVDYFWKTLGEGGDERAKQCGWLKDKYGVSWQIVPEILPSLLINKDTVKAQRALQAMLQMKKLDIAALQRAFDG